MYSWNEIIFYWKLLFITVCVTSKDVISANGFQIFGESSN